MKFSSCVDNSLLGLLDLVNICNRAFVVQFVCLVSLIQYFTYEKKKKKKYNYLRFTTETNNPRRNSIRAKL
jgi:hypothetical protein